MCVCVCTLPASTLTATDNGLDTYGTPTRAKAAGVYADDHTAADTGQRDGCCNTCTPAQTSHKPSADALERERGSLDDACAGRFQVIVGVWEVCPNQRENKKSKRHARTRKTWL